MAIHPAYAQVSALLVAVFVLIAGNGLSNTLIPLSATAAAFPPLSIGLIASSYFGGMLIGCIAAPRVVARAGHIRAFAAFVAIAAVTTLLHPIFVDPIAWALIRAVTVSASPASMPRSKAGCTTRPTTWCAGRCWRSTRSCTTRAARRGSRRYG